jgi:hypothetical protein
MSSSGPAQCTCTVGTHKHRHPLFSFFCPNTLKHATFSGEKPCSQGAGGWRCLCVHTVVELDNLSCKMQFMNTFPTCDLHPRRQRASQVGRPHRGCAATKCCAGLNCGLNGWDTSTNPTHRTDCCNRRLDSHGRGQETRRASNHTGPACSTATTTTIHSVIGNVIPIAPVSVSVSSSTGST